MELLPRRAVQPADATACVQLQAGDHLRPKDNPLAVALEGARRRFPEPGGPELVRHEEFAAVWTKGHLGPPSFVLQGRTDRLLRGGIPEPGRLVERNCKKSRAVRAEHYAAYDFLMMQRRAEGEGLECGQIPEPGSPVREPRQHPRAVRAIG